MRLTKSKVKTLNPIKTGEMKESVTNRILFLLDKKGWTKGELAAKLQIHQTSMTPWFSGHHNFSLETICALEIVFGEKIINVQEEK